MTDVPAPVYHIADPDAIHSPAFIVFRPLVQSNLDQMIRIAGDPQRLRPHCKTHKMAAVTRLALARGIQKHKAATFAEAEMLAQAGVTDIVLAYHPVGPNIPRTVRFRERFPQVTFTVTADDPATVIKLGETLAASRQTVNVLLDINPGRDRTGLPCGDAAAELYQLIHQTPGLIPGGLHVYDGHVKQANFQERCRVVDVEWQKFLSLREELEASGIPVPRILCGGTPTFPVYAAMEDPAIELCPGTSVFHDAGYSDGFPDLHPFHPAALVLTRVVSCPRPGRLTLDMGTKAVAADPPLAQRFLLPEIPDAKPVLQNEEHLVIESARADRFRPGDWTLAIPGHVCPTSALYPRAIVIEDGEIVDTWEVTARDRQLTI